LLDMRLWYGYGGWIRVQSEDSPGWAYLRLADDGHGGWRTRELYVNAGENVIPAVALRKLPLAKIEALAVQGEGREHLDKRMRSPGPQLSVMAESFTTRYIGKRGNCETCGSPVDPKHGRCLDWLETSWWAQFDQPDVQVRVRQPNRRPRAKPDERKAPPEPSPLSSPDDGLTDEFFKQVRAAYDAAVNAGRPPAPTLAEQAGTTVRTVHRWVYLARKRGIMQPGKPGRAG
jgi:hypothetical protein